MAHTPGPWILMSVPTSVGSCHKVGPFPNGDRSATFACVYADGHRLGIDDASPASAELAANARLIAAAPDLLQALLNLVGTMCSADGSNMEADLDAIDSCVADAHAAIAKATGRTQ